MKKTLLTPPSNLKNIIGAKPLGFVLALLVVLVFSPILKMQGQTCIGPYQGFESCNTKVTMQGSGTSSDWKFSASANATSSAASSRNGSYFITLPNPGQSVVSPLLSNPDKFQFYYRSSSAINNTTFRVEYSTDSTFPDTVGAPTITGPAFTTSGTSYVSTGLIDLSAYSSIYVRIRSLATNPMINTVPTNSVLTFTPLSGSTTVAINSDEAISGAVPIGFNFAYNGTIYSNVYASSNGFLSFNSSATSTPANNLTSPAASLLPLLAPLWDDLDGSSGTASYLTTGTSGSRIFTFEWLNWKWSVAAATPVISFQVKLYEATGKVEYVYRSDAGAVSSGSASVGLTGNNSGEYKSLSNLTTTMNSNSSETATIATKPPTGQTIGFAGPTGVAVFLDDFSWTSRIASQNVIVVPEYGTTTCGSVTPIYVPNVASGTSYTFYDQGGFNDGYTKAQTQTLYFAPTSASEKVQLTLTALGLDTLTPAGTIVTTITIYNGNGTGGAVLGTITNASAPALNTTYVSQNFGDYITVVFTTSNAVGLLTAAHTGFAFNVKCVLPPTITSLGSSSGCDGGSLVINGTNFTGATAATVKVGGSGGTAVTSAVVSGGGTVLTVVPANGTMGVIYVSTPGGNVTNAVSYTSNALPTVSITGSSTICASGGTTTLSPITGGTWTSNTPASATVTNAGAVTGVAAGSATFTFTSSTAPNCANTTTAVTVNALPTVSITGASSICVSSGTTTLSPTTGGTWVSNTPASATVTNAGAVTAVAAGSSTFTFTSSTAPNCANTTTAVTVTALPTVSIIGSSSICASGGTTTLSPITGGNWVSNTPASASVTNAGLVTGVAAGSSTFTFTSSTAPNCANTTTAVTVTALPTVSITGSSSICAGGGTTTLSPTSGGTWASSDVTKATVTNAGVVTGVAAGSATFTFTSSTAPNCSATTGAVTVNALPVVTAGSSVCMGSTITLSPTSGGTWASSDATKATVTNAGVVTGVALGSVTFTFTDMTTTCSATTSSVTVNALPVVTAGALVCVGSTITLSPTTGGTWASSDATKATVTNAGVVTGVAAGSVTFTFTNTTTTCSATTSSVTIITIPSAPVASAGTGATAGSFTANWAASAGATGYYLDVATDSGFTALVSGYNNLSVLNVTTYSVTGLSIGTTYYYRVRAANTTCGSSVNSSTITYATLSPTYCDPSYVGSNGTSYYLSNFTTTQGITNINNTSVRSTNAYGNYANTVSCSQYPGNPISFKFTTSNSSSYYYYIWIDWNSDGDFLDAGETILATTSYAFGPYSGTFAVPGGQAAGNYRMRVAVSFIYTYDSCNFISMNKGYGEFEDYTFTVAPIPPCSLGSPSGLVASDITANGAKITWSDPSFFPSSTYDYYVSSSSTPPVGVTIPSGNVANATNVTLSGLTLGNTYYVWVRSNCSGIYNSWVGPVSFLTVNLDIIQTSSSGSIATCNAKFYDSGGSSGNYTNNESYTYTINSGSAGSSIKAVFNSFSTESGFDYLTVYDGPTTSSNLIGSYSGTSITAGQKFISTDSSGALTFTFYSDYSVYSSGWDATITCVQLPKISNFLPSSICVGATPLVTITGVNFTGTTTVKFNGVAASSFTVVNSTTITATFPTGGTTGPITLSNGTDSNDSVANFQVNAYPAAPNAGPDVSICTGNSTTLSGTSVSNSTTTVLSQDFNAGPWPAGWSRPLGDYRTSFEYVSSGNTWPPNGYTGYCSYFWTYVTSAGVSDDMITPLMDLSSYTTANLTFWIYNSDGTDTLKVYANNNGGAYTQVGSTYATYGSWTQITISLNSFVGSVFTDVRLKFTGTSDYGFSNIGIDDIVVTGNVSATYVWSPSTGLSSTTILAPTANPTTTTIYTLTTTNPAGCSISDDVVVTVIPIVAGVASSSQTICGGSPADLTLTGSSGTIQWQYADNLAFNLNVNAIAGANSATLTSAQMGLLAANRYYRAVLTNGICTLYSNIITITISGSSTTWNSGSWSNGSPDATKAAIFNGPYTSSGDISACSISVTALGSVTILTGHTVTVQNVVSVNSSGSLIFQDGSSLVQPNAVTNSAGVYSGGNVGNITYMRTASPMFKFDYTYWSSPVYPQNLLAFSPLTPLFYQYDGITANQWQYTNASATTMVVGKGYLARAPSNFPVYVTPIPPSPAAFTGSFVGVPNNGSQSVQIGVAQGVNQFNLIGNPYPSAVLADSFISANPNVGALYFWTHNTNINQTTYLYTNNDYAVYTLLGGTGTVKSPNSGAGISTKPLGNIAAGQGFFTKGVASITGAGPNYYATFTNAMRIAGNNTQFFKTTGPVTQNNNPFEKHRYWLDISNTEGAFREVLVGYVETATLGFDRLFDGQMSESSNVLSMYTLVEGKKMAIQGRPLPFDINDTVPLCYKSSIASTYTVSLPDYDGLFTSQHVYLEDTLLHVIHDLRVSPYTFVTEIGTFESRFILRYTTATLGTSTSLFNENSVIVYKNEHGLFINSGASIMHAVKIFDIRGRLIASREGINATTTSFTTLPTTQQVLLVQITSEEGVSVTKKVVY